MIVHTGHKSRTIADYILFLSGKHDKKITPMQLLKLVYICHGWMLGLHGKPLICENAEAWQYGPVFPLVYRDFKKYGRSVITDVPSCAPHGLDAMEIDVIEQVWNGYSSYSGLQLSALTHQTGTPWEITMLLGSDGKIGNELIQHHYRSLVVNG